MIVACKNKQKKTKKRESERETENNGIALKTNSTWHFSYAFLMQMRPKCTGRARKLGRNATPSAPRFGANFQKTMPKLGLHCSISLNPKCYPIRPALRSLQFSASSVQNRPGTSLNEPCTDSPASAGIEFCQLVLHKLAHCDMPNTQMPQLLKLQLVHQVQVNQMDLHFALPCATFSVYYSPYRGAYTEIIRPCYRDTTCTPPTESPMRESPINYTAHANSAQLTAHVGANSIGVRGRERPVRKQS